MELGFIISAFIAGLLTFLAPCTLPIVPAYLGFISGVSKEELKDPSKAKEARKKIFLNGVFFVVGFSLIFIFFGAVAGFFGQTLTIFRVWLTRIGGVIIILFGLFMVGLLKLSFLQREKRIKAPSFLTIGKPTSSLALGGAFGVGWTPCVGPILGSILLLASSTSTVSQGALLLGVFSLGLAVPFLLVAGGFSSFINRISKYLNTISIIGGIFLVLLGILMVTGNFSLLISYGYRIFQFIEYDRLLDYL